MQIVNKPTDVIPFEFADLGNPILFVNDAPERLGGLSRIGRDIASLVTTMPEFRVGYLGRGSVGRSGYPWAQYSYPESGQWGEDHIASVWEDFSHGKPGIIMSLWDASRMLWFANPRGTNPQLERFLGDGRNFLKWGYFPVDAKGPNDRSYGTEMSAAIQGYDRVCAASEWGAEVLKESGGHDVDWIPHGIWPDKFFRDEQRTSKFTVGCVMANQSRKDWPVAFECAAILKRQYGNKFSFWCHTDRNIGYWNLYALAQDYGLTDSILVTNVLEDWAMRQNYSDCEVTIVPSAGEGFGYPIAESMACGTACVVTDYAAGQEIVPEFCRVHPCAYRVDTQFNLRRAITSGANFARVAKHQIDKRRADPVGQAKWVREQIDHLSWPKLETVWRKWFLNGIGH